jgi:hypothetical protein
VPVVVEVEDDCVYCGYADGVLCGRSSWHDDEE